MLSWKEVEEQLVAAVRLSWRMPSGGRWPFASDGPWDKILPQSLADGAFDAWRKDREDQIAREMRNSPSTSPLTAAEVDWMEARFAWLLHAPEVDRKLVWVTLVEKAADRGRLSWTRVRERLARNRHWQEVSASNRGLGMRYSRALTTVTQAVNVGAGGVPA